MNSPQTCVIGAGATGLVASKILHERGVPFECFEMGSGIGGLWRFNNDNGRSAAYRSLHINSSRKMMAFSDFKMPAHYPDFPHHSDIFAYYEEYVDHFGFRDRIRFRTSVVSVDPDHGRFHVHINGPAGRQERIFDHVIVCNGHHWSPKMPDFKGTFNGRSFHSFDYKSPDGLEGKRVLVVGMGNSGCDISCDVSRVTETTFLSTRTSAHIIPKYILGKPLDRACPAVVWNYVPFRVFQMFFGTVLRVTRGKTSRFGIPNPAHRILEEHPTVSSDLINLIGHGRIHMVPNVDELLGNSVRFANGRQERIDVIIYATGYNIGFPFLASEILDPKDNEVPLYRRVVHPSHPGLYFLGLVQPWGPLNPLSEAQAEWVADLIQGKGDLPSATQMQKAIALCRVRDRKRYGNSARHSIQVDFHPYLRELRLERSSCSRRHTKARMRRRISFPFCRTHDTPKSRRTA